MKHRDFSSGERYQGRFTFLVEQNGRASPIRQHSPDCGYSEIGYRPASCLTRPVEVADYPELAEVCQMKTILRFGLKLIPGNELDMCGYREGKHGSVFQLSACLARTVYSKKENSSTSDSRVSHSYSQHARKRHHILARIGLQFYATMQGGLRDIRPLVLEIQRER
jgi:hypothetical protein